MTITDRRFCGIKVLIFGAAFCVLEPCSLALAEDSDVRAREHLELFLTNLRSVVTCDIRVERCGSSVDWNAVTNQTRIRKKNEIIRRDEVRRVLRAEGVVDERLEIQWYDGHQTVDYQANFPGLPRNYTAAIPRGIRCTISVGISSVFNSVLCTEVLGFRTISLGGLIPFDEAIAQATNVSVADASKPTVRVTLADTNDGNRIAKNRVIEFDLDPKHGWWISEARLSCDRVVDSRSMIQRGKIVVEDYHDLGNSRFFPKLIQFSTFDDRGKSQRGPTIRVVECSINQPIDEKDLVFELPRGLPISQERERKGDLVYSDMLVKSQSGEERRFSEHREFVEFLRQVSNENQWSGKYEPPPGFLYHFTTVEQAREFFQEELKSLPPTSEQRGIPEAIVVNSRTTFRLRTGIAIGLLTLSGCLLLFLVRRQVRNRSGT